MTESDQRGGVPSEGTVSAALNYWNSAYSTLDLERSPSAFARFVADSWMPCGGTRVIDIGCGNGRDTFLFSSLRLATVGMDFSEAAIADNRAYAAGQVLHRPTFVSADVADGVEFPKALAHEREEFRSTSALFYSRFFLHAIDNAAEQVLIRALSSCARSGDRLAVEFRTDKDAHLSKTYGGHYRRFSAPGPLISSLLGNAFRPLFFVEGQGFAPFGNEDPHVARLIAEKS